ncbi:MAG: mechanosensitive ion channel family protein [Hyphomicrobiales bacterium]
MVLEMEFLSAIDRIVQDHVWFSLAIVLVLLVWIAITRYFFYEATSQKHQSIVATVDLVLFPAAILSIGGLLYFSLQSTQFSLVETQLQFVVHLMAILALSWCVARFIEIFILSKSKRDDISNYLPGLERGLLYISALFIGLMIFLNMRDVSITGLYVSTGAAAALIAFAMQRTLGDLFSGIALSIEHPFRVGDWVELSDGTQGKIIDINWRATRIRAWDNATMIVPNSELAQQSIKNLHGAGHSFSPWYEIKISADVDPRFAKALLLEAALRCSKVMKSPLPVVRLKDATTIPYTYMVWVHYKDFLTMFAGREELFREIHYGLKQAGIQVAPDTHEIHSRRAETMNIELPSVLLALKGLDVANILTDREVEQMASMSQHHSFEAGTVILPEGDTATSFDILSTGIIESSIQTNKGVSKTVDRLKPGQYFGIASMITDNPSFLEFTAITDVSLIRVDLDCFRTIISNRPELSEELAEIVKQRMDAAEDARAFCNKPPQKLSVQEILKSVEKLLH